MTDNLRLWTPHEDIDPKFTKAITGRDYGGTSPSPQYVIKCLTMMFGPVGIGFGWRVVSEGFERFGDTALHWCRIEFWHSDKSNVFEAYGQTKAAYITAKGQHRVDEDAPKKSLTDAIVKAASQIGVAANIFLGRWDDAKYVAQVNAEYREEERAAARGRFDAREAADMLCAALSKARDEAELKSIWDAEETARKRVHDASQADYERVKAAASARKAEISQRSAA